MLYSEIEELIKLATSEEQPTAEAEEASNIDNDYDIHINNLVSEIDSEIASMLEKRAGKVAIAKLLTALDVLM